MSGVYYNEIDPFCVQWLRNLIAAGHIAPGDVDERSIEDVRQDDLRGYTQCHFFAGIGVWSYALRRAGWSDDRPVWTGSCPCQPFSAAGAGAGFADERHLWPAFHHLIKEHHEWCKRQKRKAPVIFGEQVASKDADPWIDLVQDDLEALGYTFGAIPFPAASVGCPGIRDRTYWVADASVGGSGLGLRDRKPRKVRRHQFADSGSIVRMADTNHNEQRQWRRSSSESQTRDESRAEPGGRGTAGRMADAHRGQLDGIAVIRRVERDRENPGRTEGGGQLEPRRDDDNAGPTNGFWRDADWLFCRDGKWRPVEPGTFPLAAGLATGMGALSTRERRLAEMAGIDSASLKRAKAYRVGSLRGYGNAINAEAAIAFIRAADAAMRTAA